MHSHLKRNRILVRKDQTNERLKLCWTKTPWMYFSFHGSSINTFWLHQNAVFICTAWPQWPLKDFFQEFVSETYFLVSATIWKYGGGIYIHLDYTAKFSFQLWMDTLAKLLAQSFFLLWNHLYLGSNLHLVLRSTVFPDPIKNSHCSLTSTLFLFQNLQNSIQSQHDIVT